MHLAAYHLGSIKEALLFEQTQDAYSGVHFPGVTAIVSRGKRLTYQDLSNRLAKLLRSEGPLARSAGSGHRPADRAAVSGCMS